MRGLKGVLELFKGFCACFSNVTAENASIRLGDSPQTGSADPERSARDAVWKNKIKHWDVTNAQGMNLGLNE